MTFDEAEAELTALISQHRRVIPHAHTLSQMTAVHTTGVMHLSFSFAPTCPFPDVPTHNVNALAWVHFSKSFTDAWESLDFMAMREQCGFITTSPADFKEAGIAPTAGSKLADRGSGFAPTVPLVLALKGPLRYQLTDAGRVAHTFCSYFEPLTPFRVVERMLRAKVPSQT